jgi:hypothetical protein
VDDPQGKLGRLEETRGSSTPKIGGQPPDNVRLELWLHNLLNEQRVVHAIKSLGNINGHCHRPNKRLVLVETISHACGNGEKGSGAWVGGLETILGGGAWERSIKKGEKETFKDLDSWGQKGDGTVRGTKRRGFVRLQNGNDGGSLPDYREVSIGDGEVKKKGKIFSSRLPKMLEMQGRKSIRTHGRGVWTVANGIIYVLLSERFELRVDFMDLMKLSLDLTRLHATFVGFNRGVLTIEALGDGSRLGKSMVTKCNGLIHPP